MEYTIIPPRRFEDVIDHLRNSFFADEPLNKSVDLCNPGEGHIELEKHSLATLNDGLSVIAISPDQEIAGVALNGILSKGEIENAIGSLNEKQDKQFKKIFNLLYGENLKLNLFERFDVDKIFEIRILSVDSKFRGQGIAKKLLLKSQEIAEENGFKVMKTDATGLFSQKISQSLGFVTCSEVRYNEYTDSNNCPIFGVESPHESLKIMFKLLDQEHATPF